MIRPQPTGLTGPPPTGLTRESVVARLRAAGCVFAEDEAALLIEHSATVGASIGRPDAAGGGTALAELVAQRTSGRPLEHVLGWAEFAGLRIPVTDGVFVPRRRSEPLARLAAEAAGQRAAESPDDPVTVVDLCCGAGALGASVASRVPAVRLYGVDIDDAAVACARRSVDRYRGTVYSGDLYAPLPAGLRHRVDVLIANAPYVPTGDIAFMPAEAREHEHAVALDGGGDGLSVLRRVVGGAPSWLAPGGVLLMECARHQAGPLGDSVTAAGLRPEVLHDDEYGATMVRASGPAEPARTRQ